MVGIEYDQLDEEPWPAIDDEPSWMTHVTQSCQWTLVAAPGHPLFRDTVDETVGAGQRLAAEKERTM